MTRLQRLIPFVPRLSALYFGIALPWCLKVLVQALPNAFQPWAPVAAFGVWALIGAIVYGEAVWDASAESRSVARWMLTGFGIDIAGGLGILFWFAYHWNC